MNRADRTNIVYDNHLETFRQMSHACEDALIELGTLLGGL
jgi:hypothetical protein